MKKLKLSEIYFPKVTQSVDDGIRLLIQVIFLLGTFILGIDRGVLFNRYLRPDDCNLEKRDIWETEISYRSSWNW